MLLTTTSLIKPNALCLVKLGVPNELQCTEALSYTDWYAHSNATALTVNNITNTLNGIAWSTIGWGILDLPESKYEQIEKQFSSDEERVSAGVREWLLQDPLASWRKLINELYVMKDTKYNTLADSILHYAEELTGMYMIMIMIHTILHHMMHAMEIAQDRQCAYTCT